MPMNDRVTEKPLLLLESGPQIRIMVQRIIPNMSAQHLFAPEILLYSIIFSPENLQYSQLTPYQQVGRIVISLLILNTKS